MHMHGISDTKGIIGLQREKIVTHGYKPIKPSIGKQEPQGTQDVKLTHI